MKTHIVIYTPVYGDPETASVRLAFHNAMLSLCRGACITWIDSRHFANVSELSKARSRAVRMALDMPEMTHLLSWDEDVCGEQLAACLSGMLASRRQIVGVPYPKKVFHWDRIVARARELASTPDRITREELEAAAYDYCYRLTPRFSKSTLDEQRCMQIDGVGCGFTLVARDTLQRMTDRYREEMSFKDLDEKISVGLFLPMIVDGELLGDDFSFCERAFAMGIPTHLYLGSGSPLDHYGSFRFRGSARALVKEGT